MHILSAAAALVGAWGGVGGVIIEMVLEAWAVGSAAEAATAAVATATIDFYKYNLDLLI